MGFWQDRPVLVTGATGLLGGWFVDQLVDSGADVVCIMRDIRPASNFTKLGLDGKVDIAFGSIEDFDFVERTVNEYEIDVIYHLAAQTIVRIGNLSPINTFESNIKGTWNILEAARRRKVRQVVIASSDKSYGSKNEPPYTEDMPLAGANSYDVSKSCGDLIALSYLETYKLPVTIVRCGNLYGGGDLNWNRIIPGTVRSVIRGQAPVIRSDGKMLRDYLYVKDAVDGYMLCGEVPEAIGQAFNFGTEKPTSVVDVVSTLLDVMGSHLQPIVKGEPSTEIPKQWLSTAKARKVLSWRPFTELRNGLGHAAKWYREYFEEAG